MQEEPPPFLAITPMPRWKAKSANTPEIIIKGAVKIALGQFFKHFEKQVVAILPPKVSYFRNKKGEGHCNSYQPFRLI